MRINYKWEQWFKIKKIFIIIIPKIIFNLMENGNESSFLGLDYVISQIKSKVIKTVIVFLPLYSQPYSRIFPADYFLSDILNSSFKYVEPTMSFNLLNDPIPT